MTTDLRDRLQVTLGTAYRIERELSGGGMSRVFVAEEIALGRRVVVKVLPPDMAAGVSVARFRQEISLAAKLQHPHIVPVLTTGEIDGLPYFTMPYIDGASLRNRLAKGELPIIEATRTLREVVSALAYAHTHGIIHRDIKPDNVLLAGGVAMVTDFGVAKALTASTLSTKGGSGLTSVGVAIGTPAYMAPEQAAGDPDTDHRADIYAIGVMAYELLAGRTPFAGRPVREMLVAHIIEAPEHVSRFRPSIPEGLAALVMRCLAKRPEDRPATAAELLQLLDSSLTPGSGTMSARWATPASTSSFAAGGGATNAARGAASVATPPAMDARSGFAPGSYGPSSMQPPYTAGTMVPSPLGGTSVPGIVPPTGSTLASVDGPPPPSARGLGLGVAVSVLALWAAASAASSGAFSSAHPGGMTLPTDESLRVYVDPMVKNLSGVVEKLWNDKFGPAIVLVVWALPVLALWGRSADTVRRAWRRHRPFNQWGRVGIAITCSAIGLVGVIGLGLPMLRLLLRWLSGNQTPW